MVNKQSVIGNVIDRYYYSIHQFRRDWLPIWANLQINLAQIAQQIRPNYSANSPKLQIGIFRIIIFLIGISQT